MPSDPNPFTELLGLLFLLFQNNPLVFNWRHWRNKGVRIFFFNPYEGFDQEFFKHWNKFLIWTLISRQALLMFSWVSFPKTRLQTDTAHCSGCLSRGRGKHYTSHGNGRPRKRCTLGLSGLDLRAASPWKPAHAIPRTRSQVPQRRINEHAVHRGRKCWGRCVSTWGPCLAHFQ